MLLRVSFLLLLSASVLAGQPSHFPIQSNDSGDHFMVSATNSYVTSTGYEVLKKGGNAIDAMVAMQMVMSVVEPDMTGIGGGTFALYYDAKKKEFHAFDGREEAPSSASPDMFMKNNKPIKRDDISGPRSVAIPGTLRLMYQTHQKYGTLPWQDLIVPAISYATNGYSMNSYTHDIIVREQERLSKDPEIKTLYWDKDDIQSAGTLMKNPKMAKTLMNIAKYGDSYLYEGTLGRHIVEEVNSRLTDDDAKLTLSDFKSYQIKEREVIHIRYRGNHIYSFGYPASGGLMVSQTLKMLENYDIGEMAITDAEPWRLMTETMRLAKADRIRYAGDPDYVETPTQQLLDDDYIATRRSLVPKGGAIKRKPAAGNVTLNGKIPADFQGYESHDTGHISIVDSEGNAIAMTSTIGSGMGAGIMVDGVILNAQMANFSTVPYIKGKPSQNSIDAGKRPRSAITPTIVTDKNGKLRLVLGSPGSAQIPGYVLKTIVGVLDWELPIQQAIDLPNIQYGTKIDRTKPYNPKGLLVEKRTFAEKLVPNFEQMGYPVHVIPVVSGVNAIEVKDGEIYGGTDRRRGSTSLGD